MSRIGDVSLSGSGGNYCSPAAQGRGMAETIFMIHGMWGGRWNFDNFKGFFEKEGYRCVAATLRHHNVDPKTAPDPRLGTTSLLDYAADLEREIRALGTKPIVIGHSMGGLLAQMLGSRGSPRRWCCRRPRRLPGSSR